jgi:hypothetical protein
MKKAFSLTVVLFFILLQVNVFAVITGWKSKNVNNGFILNMNLDYSGNLWFGTSDGITKLSAAGTTIIYNTGNSDLYDNPIFSMAQDRDTNMWFGTYEGLSKLSADGNTWTTYTIYNQLSGLNCKDNAIIRDIDQDIDGNIWILTSVSDYMDLGDTVVFDAYRGGIAKLDTIGHWSFYIMNTYFASFEVKTIHGFYNDNDGNMWVYALGGVSKIDTNGTCTTYTPLNSGLACDTYYGVYAAMQDHSGNMWFGSSEGVSKLSADGTTWTTYNESNSGLPENSVSRIFQDKYNNIWFNSGGATRLSPDGTWVTFTGVGAYNAETHRYVDPQETDEYEYPDCLSEKINCIAEDFSGNIWVGTHGDGLAEAICVPIYLNVDTLGIGTKTGSSASFSIVSEVSWTAAYDASRFSVDPSSGVAGADVITVTKSSGETDTLSASIIITGNEGSQDSVIVSPLSFLVSKEKIILGADAWSYDSFTVQSNGLWEVTYSQEYTWLALVSDSGITDQETPIAIMGSDTIMVLAFSENNSVTSRTDTLHITAGTIEKSIAVTQKALISCSKHSILLDSDSGSYNIFFLDIGKLAGVQWTASKDSSWFSIDKTTGKDSLGSVSTITVTTLSVNSGYDSRCGHIILSASGLTDTIEICQEASAEISPNLDLTTITLTDGADECFNAYDTITVAGGGNTVEFLNGSTVELIAGKSIFLLPGFHAFAGSLTHASITEDNTFCAGISGITIADQSAEKSTKYKQIPEKQTIVSSEKSVKIYPNPNNGQFTLELSNIEKDASVCIYNLLGTQIYHSTATSQTSYKVNLPEIKRGIYFVKVTDRKEQYIRKMVVD